MVKGSTAGLAGISSPISVYKLRPEMFAHERRYLLALLGVFLLFVGSFLVAGFVGGANPVGMLFGSILAVLTLGTASTMMIRHRRQTWATFRLVLFPGLIVRTREGYIDLAIPITQITELIRSPAGGYTIRGAKRAHVIEVPPGIDSSEGLENDLANLVPHVRIVTKGVTGAQLKNAFVGIGAVLVLYSSNPWVVLVVSPFVVWPVLRDTWTLRNDPRVEETMRSRWLSSILLALVIVAKAAFVVFTVLRRYVG